MFLGELVSHPSSSSVEQAFVRRDERRAPLNSPAWEARLGYAIKKLICDKEIDLPCDFKLRNLFQCNVKLSARKDSLVVGSPRKYFDFNSLKSPFLAWASESFRQDIGQISIWEVFFIIKMYLL